MDRMIFSQEIHTGHQRVCTETKIAVVFTKLIFKIAPAEFSANDTKLRCRGNGRYVERRVGRHGESSNENTMRETLSRFQEPEFICREIVIRRETGFLDCSAITSEEVEVLD